MFSGNKSLLRTIPISSSQKDQVEDEFQEIPNPTKSTPNHSHVDELFWSTPSPQDDSEEASDLYLSLPEVDVRIVVF